VAQGLRAHGLSPQLAAALDDEGDSFNISNNFHIRRNDDRQLRDYDVIWLTRIFYFYLATIYAVLHTIERVVP
jgi:hypothetical protein